MNILFITRYPITDQKGGIERITDCIIQSFPSEYNFYSAYINESHFKRTPVKAAICINKDAHLLYEFVNQNKIEIIINQQCQELNKIIFNIKKNINVRTIYFQHDKTIEPYIPQLKSLRYALFADIDKLAKLIYLSKYLLFPLYRKLKKLRDKYLFRNIYEQNDKILVLTERYIPVFLKTMGMRNDFRHKIGFINNCVTLDVSPISSILSRPRKVLIISRMTEERKRILLALKIWNKLQFEYPLLSTWQLELVGSGEYLSFYRKYVKKKSIANIVFTGQVEDTGIYYASAQIFMMTSHSEGWGLTVTEAQQYGLIPICFNSYEAINDLINNNYNGILIKDGNVKEYVDQLAGLMLSPEKRSILSSNAQKSCSRFSVSTITNQWISLFNDVSSPRKL